jgi:hypothetical protein
MHCTAACATPRPPPTRCTALLHQRRTIHAGADEVLRRAIARSLGLTQVRRECTTARHVARAAIASSVRSMPNAMLSPWNAVCGQNMPHHRHTHTHTPTTTTTTTTAAPPPPAVSSQGTRPCSGRVHRCRGHTSRRPVVRQGSWVG